MNVPTVKTCKVIERPWLPTLQKSFMQNLCVCTTGWFDIEDAHNHNVYVSGLPLDTTLDEFKEIMTKYGIIMEDEQGKTQGRE